MPRDPELVSETRGWFAKADVYLEITYRRGKPFAAYLYLERRPGDVAAETRKIGEGLLLDLSADGRPIGIEITSPRNADIDALNRALAPFDLEPVSAEDLAPLAAARSVGTPPPGGQASDSPARGGCPDDAG